MESLMKRDVQMIVYQLETTIIALKMTLNKQQFAVLLLKLRIVFSAYVQAFLMIQKKSIDHWTSQYQFFKQSLPYQL